MPHANSAAFSFSNRKKELDFGMPEKLKSSQLVPGPGNYKEIDSKHVASKTTTYSFGKEPRIPEIRSNSPGPGSYGHVSTEVIKSKGPKFTLGKSDKPKDLFVNVEEGSLFFARSTDGFRSSFPGPGQYQVDAGISKIKPRVRSVAVSKVTKDIDYNNKIPGPGSYDNNTLKVKSKKPQWSVAKTVREDPFMPEKEKKELEKVPGPGNYNLNTSIGTGRKTVVRGKPKYNSDNGVPGPGSYNENKQKLLKKAPGWKDDVYIVHKPSVQIPGPGVYQTKSSFDPKVIPGYKFSQLAKMPDIKSGTPGPGYYNINNTIGVIAPYYKIKTSG